MRRFATIVAAALAAGLVSPAAAQDKPTLTVMTYASFAGKYGPGPKLKDAFEAGCGCTLVWQASEDSGAMVARLKLEGTAATADAVVGIDANLTAEARAAGVFAPHGLPTPQALPTAWKDDSFLPFDYGWFAFVYDSSKMKKPPQSMAELIAARSDELKIVVQDPRSSSVGLGGLLWLRAIYGDKADEAWAKLKPKIVTVTKGWSEAYGLFLKGEADMVLSYTTSPAYHLIAEKKEQYRAATFDEGHYLQIETAGVLASSKQKELATKFLAFLVGPEAQKLIPTSQWMYPVHPAAQLPAEFGKLNIPGRTLTTPAEQVAKNRRGWIDGWLAALAR